MLRTSARCGGFAALRASLAKTLARFAQLRALRVRIPRLSVAKSPPPQGHRAESVRLAECWGFEPQIPLWGILA